MTDNPENLPSTINNAQELPPVLETEIQIIIEGSDLSRPGQVIEAILKQADNLGIKITPQVNQIIAQKVTAAKVMSESRQACEDFQNEIDQKAA